MSRAWSSMFRRAQPVAPRPRGEAATAGEDRALVRARVEGEPTTPGGASVDRLAAAVFSGEAGRARAAPLFERFDAEVGGLSADDPEFHLMQVTRMDWALCDVAVGVDAGDTWAWRLLSGTVPGVELEWTPCSRAAVGAVSGVFEIFPGQPTWVRDRISGVVLRLLENVGPWPNAQPGRPAAVWELRLIPDASGGFWIARPPIDYPLDLLETLDEALPRRFTEPLWPSIQDLRRARLRTLRAGERTPIARMLRWE